MTLRRVSVNPPAYDALAHRELAAEISHVEQHGRVLDGGDRVAQRNEPVTLPDVVWVEVGQRQHIVGVAAVGGHQRRKPRQRRAPDQQHVH
jgi:ribosomal 50S subunit-recycling heat shock protein